MKIEGKNIKDRGIGAKVKKLLDKKKNRLKK
jgi:hypothetical protein